MGLGFVGDIKGIEIRSEASWFKPLEDDSMPEHFMGVIGSGYRFENTLYLSAEYLYNGAVLSDELKDNDLGVAMVMLEGISDFGDLEQVMGNGGGYYLIRILALECLIGMLIRSTPFIR